MGKAETHFDLEAKAKVQRKKLHQGRIISLVEDRVEYADSQVKIFDLVFHPGAVAMIPIDSSGKIILVRQWRRAANQILTELPAGTLEGNEDPAECAQRELREEIGMEAKEIVSLGNFFTAPGFCSECIHLYLAKELRSNPLVAEDTDEIDTYALTLDEALDQIDEGKIIDAKTIAGIYRYNRILEKT